MLTLQPNRKGEPFAIGTNYRTYPRSPGHAQVSLSKPTKITTTPQGAPFRVVHSFHEPHFRDCGSERKRERESARPMIRSANECYPRCFGDVADLVFSSDHGDVSRDCGSVR